MWQCMVLLYATFMLYGALHNLIHSIFIWGNKHWLKQVSYFCFSLVNTSIKYLKISTECKPTIRQDTKCTETLQYSLNFEMYKNLFTARINVQFYWIPKRLCLIYSTTSRILWKNNIWSGKTSVSNYGKWGSCTACCVHGKRVLWVTPIK